MEEKDLAYTAGMLDGEGSIGIYRRDVGYAVWYTLCVSICNTNLDVLIQFQKWFGGNIVGYKGKPWCKVTYRWRVDALKGETFLRVVYPFLRIKKGHADIALTFRKYQGGRGERNPEHEELLGLLYEELKALNKRGI